MIWLESFSPVPGPSNLDGSGFADSPDARREVGVVLADNSDDMTSVPFDLSTKMVNPFQFCDEDLRKCLPTIARINTI
jgi:hypothetical protein